MSKIIFSLLYMLVLLFPMFFAFSSWYILYAHHYTGKIYKCAVYNIGWPNSLFLWAIDYFPHTSSKFDGGEMLAYSNVISYFTSLRHIDSPLNLIWWILLIFLRKLWATIVVVYCMCRIYFTMPQSLYFMTSTLCPKVEKLSSTLVTN